MEGTLANMHRKLDEKWKVHTDTLIYIIKYADLLNVKTF